MLCQPNFASSVDNTNVVLTLPNSSFPLAQWTGLEVRELYGIVARFSVGDAYFELEDTFYEVHDLVEMPLEGSHEVFMYELSPSLGFEYYP